MYKLFSLSLHKRDIYISYIYRERDRERDKRKEIDKRILY